MHGSAVRKMEREVKDPELRKLLMPDYPVGCRRYVHTVLFVCSHRFQSLTVLLLYFSLTPHESFLQCIQQPNVTLSVDPIVRIVPEGVVVRRPDGSEHTFECEVLVLATGYDTRFIPGFEVRGRNGHVIEEDWANYATSYHSLAAAHYPNFFFVLGPSAPLGSNSALQILERTVKYIYQHVLAQVAYGIRSVDAKEDVAREWFNWGQDWLKKSVWASRGCGGEVLRKTSDILNVEEMNNPFPLPPLQGGTKRAVKSTTAVLSKLFTRAQQTRSYASLPKSTSATST